MMGCKHAYTIKIKSYYDKKLECMVRRETDTCIFCRRKEKERVIWVNDPPKRKLPRFYY